MLDLGSEGEGIIWTYPRLLLADVIGCVVIMRFIEFLGVPRPECVSQVFFS